MRRTLIIAEAGVNHNGSMESAKKLIDAAAGAGADYVKFQTFRADNLVAAGAKKADYQEKTTGKDESQLEMLRKLELTPAQHLELIDYCSQKKIKFFSTAFDLESVDFLGSLGLGLWKIPSGEITNYPYLKKIAGYGEPVILSTGMSEMQEIREAMEILVKNGIDKSQVTVLHCNTEYPTPMEDVNLRAISYIARELGVETGYSDHTAGIEIPVAAVALGAVVIEKHFTLDRNLPGPDQKASLEPDELKAMVAAIRNVEMALGNAEKSVTVSERKNLVIARKSIVALKPIGKGEIFTEDNLAVKRPGSGISPMKWEEVLGRKAKKNFKPDDLIEL